VRSVLNPSLYQFGEFSLDCNRYELLRGDGNIKLEKIPMELLILLVSRNGNLVTRQEIIEHLWGKDVFVDTEHGINTAVRKIRAALRDDAERPRYVQTVPGKGYRFAGERRNGNANSVATAQEPKLESVKTPGATAPAPVVRHYWKWGVAALLALALVISVTFALNLEKLRDRILGENQIGPIHSIAVLPLLNLSGDPSQNYYADGMTDELITALAQNHSLRVVSRTSAMQYKGVNKPLPEIAQALEVDGILEGSVNRSGNHVHIDLQLIYAPTDTHVWAQSYDRDLSGAMALPEEVSQTIATEAKVAAAPVKLQRPVNPAAHDAYLRGRYAWFAQDNLGSLKYFEQAIQIQPDYATAWDGVADVYGARAVMGQLLPQEAMEKAETAARKALELDDTLPEVHNTMAALYLFDKWDWQHADEESRRAIELKPDFAEAHHVHSYVLMVLNRDEDALQEQKRSTEIDPFARPWALGMTYIQLHQYDAAISDLRLRAEAQPSDSLVHLYLSEAYWLKGMWKESEQELEKGLRLAGNGKMAEADHKAFERGGEKAVEQLGVDSILAGAHKQYVSQLDIAQAYAFLGDKEHTLKYLEGAYRERSPWLVFLQKEPVYDFLHKDPRYRSIVRNMGLPPAWKN
jgi:TolB-like protein/DNA-binding winged helix-turn-helix (wHTH) protein/Tfp pilus assembly protein PilF